MSTKRREYEYGRIVSVDIVQLGDNLAVDTATGATSITVEDAADFDEDGGQLLLDGVIYAYSTWVEDDATGVGTITLLTPLSADATEGTVVSVYDPLYSRAASDKVAQVVLTGDDGNTDMLEAQIALHLTDKIDEGIRGGNGEQVKLELEGDEWIIVDVFGLSDLPDVGGVTAFWNDSTIVTATGDQEITLSFLPIDNSEHVYWNGVYQAAPEWTRDGQVISLPDPGTVMKVDDRITVEYAYLDGAVIVTPDVPDTGIEYPAGTLHTPTCDAPVWIPDPVGDGWGSWWQTTHFVVDAAEGESFFVYVVDKQFDLSSGYALLFDLTTYLGTNYKWLPSGATTPPVGAGLHPITLSLTRKSSPDRHTPYEPQGVPVWKTVGAGFYRNYGAPYLYDDVPQDMASGSEQFARIGVTDATLQAAYWGTKVATYAPDTRDEPVGPLPGGS